jgi:hypothetical protein
MMIPGFGGVGAWRFLENLILTRQVLRIVFGLLSPEVKTSGCPKAKPTEGVGRSRPAFLSPFSGLVGSAAGGFNLWRCKGTLPSTKITS